MSLLARFQLQGRSTSNGGPLAGSRGRSLSRSPASSPAHSPARSPARSLHSPSRSLSPDLDELQPPPPNQGDRRRPRSDSMEDVERQRALKRQKKYALDVAQEYELEDDSLNAFAELALPEMLIRIYGKLLAIERAREKEEYYAFIFSDQFKEILKDRLRSCLLSPHLTYYLDHLPDNIWKLIHKNLAMFKIPAKALNEPRIPDHIDSLMRDILTKQRGTIKQKIALSIKSKQHISLLAKALLQSGYYEVTSSQWARFAFLRKSLVMFNELVFESMAKTVAAANPGQSGNATVEGNGSACEANNESSDETASRDWVQADFWEFVDSLLDDIRADAAKNTESQDEQRKKLEKFFTDCLQDDMQIYRATKRSCPVPQALGQPISDWQRAIHQELVWS